jgi:Kae1-associated kinase Bud32
MRGAEAVLKKSKFLGRDILVKERIRKTYRIKELDEKLRRERTRQEAKLLHRAKIAGVECPTVLFLEEFSIGMTRLMGKRPKMDGKEAQIAGGILAKLHNADIIHGDFTPANLIIVKRNKGGLLGVKHFRGERPPEGLFAIDFGLGFFSSDIEDKAIDVLTMLKSIKRGDEFLRGYGKISKQFGKIKERVEEIKKRARYA